jgi:hypothetical protein
VMHSRIGMLLIYPDDAEVIAKRWARLHVAGARFKLPLQYLSRGGRRNRGFWAYSPWKWRAALIWESPRADVSRRNHCSCWHSAARGCTGLSISSRKASQIVRRASRRRRSARTGVSGRVPMDARIVQDG